MQSILTQTGLAVVHSIWQMAILWLLYKGLVSTAKFRAETKFRLALILIMGGTIIFLQSLGTALFSTYTSTYYTNLRPLEGLLPPSIVSVINGWLGAFYIAMLVFYGVKGKNDWASFRQYKLSGSIKPPPSLRLFVEKHATWMGIRVNIRLSIGTTEIPATFGWLKPVILLPAACMANLSMQQLEAVILHELAHIKRHDFIWGLFFYAAEKILWFNPFLLNLIKEARQEAENACDDWVVQFEYSPKEYAFALLQVAKCTPHKSLALSARGTNDFQLLRRVKRMLGLPVTRPQMPGWKEVFFGALLIFLSLLLQCIPTKIPNSRFKQPKGLMASVTYDHNNFSLEQTFLQARLTIFEAAVGKSVLKEKKQLPENISPNKQPRIQKKEETKLKEIEQEFAVQTSEELTSKRLMLSAGWANEMYRADLDSVLHAEWNGLEALLEKLEKFGSLKEDEWKALTHYIAVHSTIKEAIFKGTMGKNAFQPAVESTEDDYLQDILLIVYDEASRTIAASLVNKNQFSEAYRHTEVAKDEQQVIFLHKKAKKTSKIISL